MSYPINSSMKNIHYQKIDERAGRNARIVAEEVQFEPDEEKVKWENANTHEKTIPHVQ